MSLRATSSGYLVGIQFVNTKSDGDQLMTSSVNTEKKEIFVNPVTSSGFFQRRTLEYPST